MTARQDVGKCERSACKAYHRSCTHIWLELMQHTALLRVVDVFSCTTQSARLDRTSTSKLLRARSRALAGR